MATAGRGIKRIPSHRNKFQQREVEWEIAEGVNSFVFSLTPGSIALLNADRRRIGLAEAVLYAGPNYCQSHMFWWTHGC